MDRSISDMPTSIPIMIEVSESLLSGGWCSPEEREGNHLKLFDRWEEQGLGKSGSSHGCRVMFSSLDIIIT